LKANVILSQFSWKAVPQLQTCLLLMMMSICLSVCLSVANMDT